MFRFAQHDKMQNGMSTNNRKHQYGHGMPCPYSLPKCTMPANYTQVHYSEQSEEFYLRLYTLKQKAVAHEATAKLYSQNLNQKADTARTEKSM